MWSKKRTWSDRQMVLGDLDERRCNFHYQLLLINCVKRKVNKTLVFSKTFSRLVQQRCTTVYFKPLEKFLPEVSNSHIRTQSRFRCCVSTPQLHVGCALAVHCQTCPLHPISNRFRHLSDGAALLVRADFFGWYQSLPRLCCISLPSISA